MLEAPRPPSEPKPQPMESKNPLPPIPQSPDNIRARTVPEGQLGDKEKSQYETQTETVEAEPAQSNSDAFFMTQVKNHLYFKLFSG